MRNAIRARLVSGVPALTGIYQPNMADSTTALPYGVVKFAGESESTIHKAYNRNVEIWLYFPITSYNELDSAVDDVISALSTEMTTANGIVFGLRCIAISADGFYDPDLKALTKTVTFIQYLIRG